MVAAVSLALGVAVGLAFGWHWVVVATVAISAFALVGDLVTIAVARSRR